MGRHHSDGAPAFASPHCPADLLGANPRAHGAVALRVGCDGQRAEAAPRSAQAHPQRERPPPHGSTLPAGRGAYGISAPDGIMVSPFPSGSSPGCPPAPAPKGTASVPRPPRAEPWVPRLGSGEPDARREGSPR